MAVDQASDFGQVHVATSTQPNIGARLNGLSAGGCSASCLNRRFRFTFVKDMRLFACLLIDAIEDTIYQTGFDQVRIGDEQTGFGVYRWYVLCPTPN